MGVSIVEKFPLLLLHTRVKVREDQIRSAIKKIHADFVYN